MTRGLNSKADSKGGSTFAGAGSTPVGSTNSARSDAEKVGEQYAIANRYQEHVSRDARRQQRDGVVVTPIEVVDFQIRSALEKVREIGREPDEGVEWLDPFGGTGVYTARLLQLVELPPQRKRVLASNCVVIEIDHEAAQFAADNLAAVYEEEIGVPGCVRVVCADTFALHPDVDLWDDDLPAILPTRRTHD